MYCFCWSILRVICKNTWCLCCVFRFTLVIFLRVEIIKQSFQGRQCPSPINLPCSLDWSLSWQILDREDPAEMWIGLAVQHDLFCRQSDKIKGMLISHDNYSTSHIPSVHSLKKTVFFIFIWSFKLHCTM